MKNNQIFIQQPYATMVVRGLRDVILNEHFSITQRIYINATAPKNDPDTPLEWRQEVINQQLFGNLPPIEELPYDKCLGFVKVLDFAYSLHSKWSISQPPSVSVYKAHEFDEPQPITERKLYDYERIPSHAFIAGEVQSRGYFSKLMIPVNEKLYAIASNGGNVSFEMTGSLSDFTNFDKGTLRDFDKFTLVCGQRSKTFFWHKDCDIYWEQDPETDELVLYPSVYNESGKAPRARLNLSCRYPLID